jgi:hydrogenase/urease accessory protein HupE
MKWRLVVFLLVAFWPQSASAHSSVLILQPFTSEPQVLALFALGLFIQQGLPETEGVFHCFWACCIAGSAVAALNLIRFEPAEQFTLIALITGIIIAAGRKLPISLSLILGAACGGLSGYNSWPDHGSTGDLILSAMSAILGSSLIVILVSSITAEINRLLELIWFSVAVRVIGSWIAAISLLLSALLYRKLV